MSNRLIISCGLPLSLALISATPRKTSSQAITEFCQNMTFETTEGCPAKDRKTEDELADALRLDVRSDVGGEKKVQQTMGDADLSDEESHSALDCKRWPDEDEDEDNESTEDADGGSDEEKVEGQLRKELNSALMTE